MRDADLVVTLGDAMKANIVAAGIPAEKILIAPNAVGGAFLEAPLDPAGARRELGLPEDGLYIGTVSSLVAYEGLDDLVRAFALLAPELPGAAPADRRRRRLQARPGGTGQSPGTFRPGNFHGPRAAGSGARSTIRPSTSLWSRARTWT